jgi:phage shock protein C
MNKTNKKLYRSEKEKIIFGVCGGLANYFEIDPVIIRMIFLFLLFTSNGVGLLLYLVLALIVPKETDYKKENILLNETGKKVQGLAKEIKDNKILISDMGIVFGILMILVGTGLLFRQIFPSQIFFIEWNILIPLLIIAFGLGLIIQRNGKK